MLLAAALLGACAAPPLNSDLAPWTSGRLSLTVAASGQQPAQSISAAFDLRGNGERGELRLSSPLGLQLVHAQWSAGRASLNTGGAVQQFDSLDELSRHALGEALPLAALPDWLAGRPWPAAPHLALASGFEQLGWRVDLSRRGEGWVTASRAAPPALALRIRLDEPAP